MKFEISHTFSKIPAAEYAELYFDETFQTSLCSTVKLGRTLLKLERTGDKIVRHVRVEPAREVPAPLAKVIGNTKFSYVEELEFDFAKRTGNWTILPSIMPDKVDARGQLIIESAGAGAKRTVRGELKVGVFGIGGIVEKFVIADVEKSYSDAAAFTERWLNEKKG